MARELQMMAPDDLGETDPPREEGGKTVEVAVVTNVRRNGAGTGLTITKRNLTFKDGLLVGQGKDYQVRVDAASASG